MSALDRGRRVRAARAFINWLSCLAWAVSLTALAGCNEIICVGPRRSPDLRPGGVYVSQIRADVECRGCEALVRGDLIQAVDGVSVRTPDELDALMGSPGTAHVLALWDRDTQAQRELYVHAPAGLPVLGVAAEALERAPHWARRRLFGHASPQLLLIDAEQRLLDSHDLVGARHLLVMFDWANSTDRQNAALILQVMQKAQADLNAVGVELLFAQVAHPISDPREPMSQAQLDEFFMTNQVPSSAGGPLPPPRLLRTPSRVEARGRPTKQTGRGGSLTYLEHLGEAPNVFVIDERGIIRWHSAGVVQDPEAKIVVDVLYTINAAVLFALRQL